MDPRLSALSPRFVDGARWFTTSPLNRRLCRLVADNEQLLAVAAACRPGPQPTILLLAADPATNELVELVTATKGPGDLVVGFGSVWAAGYNFNQLWRVSP